MNRSNHFSTLVVAVTGVSVLAAEPFDLAWNTIDGGGVMRGASADGRFELSGTIGQTDAGVMAGGPFTLNSGFWLENPPGDCNATGTSDLLDYQAFADCLTGPDVEVLVTDECQCFDADGSGTVDLADFSGIQMDFLGE